MTRLLLPALFAAACSGAATTPAESTPPTLPARRAEPEPVVGQSEAPGAPPQATDPVADRPVAEPRPTFAGSVYARPEALREASKLADAGKWAAAKRSAAEVLSKEEDLPLEVRLHAHAAVAQALMKMNDARGADEAYASVRSIWDASAETRGALKNEAHGQALYAVGEAHFHFAEKKRIAVEKIAMPKMMRARDAKSVDAFTKTKVKRWVESKRAAVREAEKAYLQVVELKPGPPPGWVVASALRVGDMYARFVSDFRSAPYPKAWDGPGFVPGIDPPMLYIELRATFIRNLEVASAPHLGNAKRAYRKCDEYARTYSIDDAFSKSCQAWLTKNDTSPVK